ncbi:MAG: 5'-methylthioadenosine/S-adenosylhomocysteine nucleosidase [Oscillospiraceae bacterium]
MKIAVICAMDAEIRLLREKMEKIENVEKCGINITTGVLCGHSVALYLGGIGKSNTAATVQYSICTFKPDLFINIGLAGNCTDCLPLGGAVIATKLVYHDFDMSIAAQDAPHTEFYTPTTELVSLAERVCGSVGVKYICGTVATGDQFIQDASIKDDIVARTGACAVEMEGAAFAHIAQKNGAKYVSIKIMSDNADNDAVDDFNASLPLGAYCETSVAIISGIAGLI